jgi:hypothetical protein
MKARVIFASSARKMLAGITSVSAVTGAAIAANARCDCGTTNALATLIRISQLHLRALTALLLQSTSHNGADHTCGWALSIGIQCSFYDRFAIAANPGSLNFLFI